MFLSTGLKRRDCLQRLKSGEEWQLGRIGTIMYLTAVLCIARASVSVTGCHYSWCDV